MQNATFSYERLVALSNLANEKICEIKTFVSQEEFEKLGGYLISLNIKCLKTTFKDDHFYKSMEEKYRKLIDRVDAIAKRNVDLPL